MTQDNDDVKVVHNQFRKARSTWAHVGHVLRTECVAPRIMAMFYKAVVQAVLSYGSKTWNLPKTILVRLEGFHIQVVYKMAVKHQP